jgi:hypothetical protein
VHLADLPLRGTVAQCGDDACVLVLLPCVVAGLRTRGVLLIERLRWRRRALLVFVAAGVAVSAYLLHFLVAFPIVSRPVGQHIEYVSPHFFTAAAMTLYLMSTTLSQFLSTHRTVKVFGVLALLSFAAAYFFYATWFISVWCFFAALMSAVVYLHFVFAGPRAGRRSGGLRFRTRGA